MAKPKTAKRKADQRLLGTRLKAARERQGLKQEYVASKLGVTQSAVPKWESGMTEPGATVLGELAALYGVTLKRLLMPDQQSFYCTKHERYHRPGYRTFLQCEELYRRT